MQIELLDINQDKKLIKKVKDCWRWRNYNLIHRSSCPLILKIWCLLTNSQWLLSLVLWLSLCEEFEILEVLRPEKSFKKAIFIFCSHWHTHFQLHYAFWCAEHELMGHLFLFCTLYCLFLHSCMLRVVASKNARLESLKKHLISCSNFFIC